MARHEVVVPEKAGHNMVTVHGHGRVQRLSRRGSARESNRRSTTNRVWRCEHQCAVGKSVKAGNRNRHGEGSDTLLT